MDEFVRKVIDVDLDADDGDFEGMNENRNLQAADDVSKIEEAIQKDGVTEPGLINGIDAAKKNPPYLHRLHKFHWCFNPDDEDLFPADGPYHGAIYGGYGGGGGYHGGGGGYGGGGRFHKRRHRRRYGGYRVRKMIIDDRFVPMEEEADDSDTELAKIEVNANGDRKLRKVGNNLKITRCFKFGDQKICCRTNKKTVFGSKFGSQDDR